MENCTKLKTGKNSKWDKNSKINKKWNLEVKKKIEIDKNRNWDKILQFISHLFVPHFSTVIKKNIQF